MSRPSKAEILTVFARTRGLKAQQRVKYTQRELHLNDVEVRWLTDLAATEEMTPAQLKQYRSIVRVGGGRGSVVDFTIDRCVITAAHCLPEMPSALSFFDENERTYQLLGPLGGETTIWARCRFVDPISDIAILGAPDSQSMSDRYDEYCAFVESCEPIEIAAPLPEEQLWVLSLDHEWDPCRARQLGGAVWLSDVRHGIQEGMSGTSAVNNHGKLVSVVVCGAGDEGESGPCPNLAIHLPGWALSPIANRDRERS